MQQHKKFSPALITPLPVNALPNALPANVPNNSPPFCYFVLFLVVSLIPYNSKSDSSSDSTIFIISSTFSFEIINAVIPDS